MTKAKVTVEYEGLPPVVFHVENCSVDQNRDVGFIRDTDGTLELTPSKTINFSVNGVILNEAPTTP